MSVCVHVCVCVCVCICLCVSVSVCVPVCVSVEAVEFHHNPAEAMEFPLEASIIHVADIIANTLDLGFQSEEKDIIPTMDEFAAKLIQVPKDSSFPNIKKQVEKEFEETVQVFLQTA